jgi:hypothetical protein
MNGIFDPHECHLTPSRRKLLAATTTVGAAITAGCLSEPLFEGNPGKSILLPIQR